MGEFPPLHLLTQLPPSNREMARREGEQPSARVLKNPISPSSVMLLSYTELLHKAEGTDGPKHTQISVFWFLEERRRLWVTHLQTTMKISSEKEHQSSSPCIHHPTQPQGQQFIFSGGTGITPVLSRTPTLQKCSVREMPLNAQCILWWVCCIWKVGGAAGLVSQDAVTAQPQPYHSNGLPLHSAFSHCLTNAKQHILGILNLGGW